MSSGTAGWARGQFRSSRPIKPFSSKDNALESSHALLSFAPPLLAILRVEQFSGDFVGLGESGGVPNTCKKIFLNATLIF